MFGDWFGHPMGNVHHVVNADADGDRSMLSFNDGETLAIWNPSGYSIAGYTILISDADRVRWERYS